MQIMEAPGCRFDSAPATMESFDLFALTSLE